MDTTAPLHGRPDSADLPLLEQLSRLAPALDGFPVDALLDVFVATEQRDRATAYRLVDQCLGNWIDSLQGGLDAFPHEPDDALQRVQARERGTRDALATLKAALSGMALVHRQPGQLC